MDCNPEQMSHLDLLVRINLLELDIRQLRVFVPAEKAKRDRLDSEQAACKVVAQERGLLDHDFQPTSIAEAMGYKEDQRLVMRQSESRDSALARLRSGSGVFADRNSLLS